MMVQRGLKRETGLVLVVCLVLLVVVTLLGLATIRGTGLETKMSSSLRDRTVAFGAAEEALRVAETWIDDTVFTDTASFNDGCAGATCFNTTCENGLCVGTTLSTNWAKKNECNNELIMPETPAWAWDGSTVNTPNVWLAATKHVKVNATDTDLATQPAYIIEFLCFANKDKALASPNTCLDGVDSDCAPQFRITALASGRTDTTKVMLQTTYKKVN